MGQQKSILLVVSNSATRKLLKTLLLVDGYAIKESDNGKEGLHLANELKPDLIIQDLALPDYDGVKLAHDFRHLPGLANVPIFALVGFLNNLERIQQLQQEFSVVIIKPVYAKLLSQYVRLYLQAPQSNLEPEDFAHPARLKAQLSLFYALTHLFSTNRRNVDHALEEVLGLTLDSAGINKALLFFKNKKDKWYLHQFIGFLPKDKEMLETLFDDVALLTEAEKNDEIIRVDEKSLDNNKRQLIEKLQIKTGLLIPIFVKKKCIAILFLADDQAFSNLCSADSQLFSLFLGKHIGQVIHSAELDKKLITLEQRSKIFLESVNCGIFIINHEGVILEANKRVETMLGYARDKIIGKTYLNILAPNEVETNTLVEKLLLEKNIGPTVTKIKNTQGKTLDIEYTIMSAVINDEQMFLAILNDVTEIERLRQQALLNDKLATVGTLAAGIVHEINNPVAWVLTNLNFLKERLKKYENDIKEYRFSKDDAYTHLEELKKELNSYHELVAESLEGIVQVKDIVRDLKGFTRIDERNEVHADIHDILNSAIKIASSQCKHKIKIQKLYADNIPKGMFERGKLQQVFLNLIINAVQSISELPEYSDKENILQIHTHLNKNEIYIDIADNGPGISPEVLPKIFDPFFTTKPTGIGTGLGLSICKEIIEQIGGRISLQTEIGKGTTFTIVIPLKVSKHSPKEITKPQGSSLIAPVRILVVDDEPTLLKTIQRILENQHKVTLAHGGQIALDLLKKNDFGFDIIITDLSMPTINGIDIYKYVKENAPGLEKHIIFMTGGTDSQHSKKFLNEVNNICVPKPFAKEELLHAIATVAVTTS